MNEIGEHTFNDDLLIEEPDQELARSAFPRLAPILVFPELVNLFRRFEKNAIKAKRTCHFIGMTAVCLGASALVGAATAPFIERAQEPWPELLGVSIAFLGVLSVSIGAFGIFFAKAKNEWLRSRLMTERLRQFHLQMLAFVVPSILAAMRGGEDLDTFIQQRRQWLAKFELNYMNHLPGRLNAVLDDQSEEQFQLHPREDVRAPLQPTPELGEIFDAYRLLRYEHQIGFASAKLGDENLGQPLRQKSFLTTLSWISILVVFFIHLLMALSLKPGWLNFIRNPLTHVLVLWAAITALAARAFEEGLQPAREVSRYSGYRATLMALEREFDEATDPIEKIRVMQMTERTMYQEMRGFLKTNHEARFVL